MTPIMRFFSYSYSALFFCFSIFALCYGSTVYAADQNTIYFPLQVNTTAPEASTQEIDNQFQKILKAKGYTTVPRSLAEQSLDYTQEWPPAADQIDSIVKQTGADYVALASLGQLAEKFSLNYSIYPADNPGKPYTSYSEVSSLDELSGQLESMILETEKYTAKQSIKVVSVEPAGNVRIDTGAILQTISTKPGDVYDPDQIREDLKSVFKMGYFENVEVDAQDSVDGKKLVFNVEEKPIISKVVITGVDKLKEDDVKDAANIGDNTILNSSQINDAAVRIKELYKSKGYFSAKVETSVSYPTPETAEVRYAIDEGEKLVIREINFQGNTSFDDDDLEDAIQTSTYAWLYSWITDAGALKEHVLDQDVARLVQFYQNHGFIEAGVGTPVIDTKEDGLYITFPVEEGPRYRVGFVDVSGDLIDEKSALLEKLKIRKEEYLNRQVLRNDTTLLTDFYAENGYAFAEVMPQLEKVDAEQRINIILNIKKGSLVYFNRIEIEGNTRTRSNVILRDLTVEEGGVFNSKDIRESTQKLRRLGFFEDISVTPKPTLSEDQMDVVVNVKEKPTGQFSIGAGYSSTEHMMLMGQISEDNIFGTGNKLSLSGKLGSETTKYNLNFTNPRLFDSQVSLGFDLFNWEREYDDYTRESTGGGVRFGHPLFEKVYIYYGYTLQNTDLSNISDDASQIIVQSKDIHLTSSANVSLVRDSRDMKFMPSKGSRNSISVEYAGGPLGGDAQFTKVEGKTGWWFPLVWNTVFHVKLAAGQAFENEDDKLPVYEHFYLGGMSSIRGFDSYSISPLDADTDEKIGGDKMWYGTISLLFPIIKDLGMQGELFTDFGNVYAVDEDWEFDEYKKTAGIGVLWMSPLGPLRLAWGYNLDKQDDENQQNWDFSIGGTF